MSILKISELLQNCWHRIIDITSFEQPLESSLDNTTNFCRNLETFRSMNMYQVSSFDFATLFTSLPHDLIKAKALSLDNWFFKGE